MTDVHLGYKNFKLLCCAAYILIVSICLPC